LDELHTKYTEALVQLFEENKEKYDVPKEAKLQFV
jgi:ribosomal protein S17E